MHAVSRERFVGRHSKGIAILASLFLGFALAFGAGVPAAGGEQGINPIAEFAGQFTVVSYGDAALNNAETEGSIAVFGALSTTKSYPIIHNSGLTPPGYEIPVIDGKPTRLVAGSFDTSGTQGLIEVSSRGWIDASQLGFVKIEDTSTLVSNVRGSTGLWVSAAGTFAGSTPGIYVPDEINQESSDLPLVSEVASYFGADQEEAVAMSARIAAGDLNDAHPVALEAGSHQGERMVTLVAGKTNLVSLTDASNNFNISFSSDSATLGPETTLIFNVPVTAGATVELPAFTDANQTNDESPNPIAPYVIYNVDPDATGIDFTLTGRKVSGSIFAPQDNTLTLNASSPIEGQIVAGNVSTSGGEIHMYGFGGLLSLDGSDGQASDAPGGEGADGDGGEDSGTGAGSGAGESPDSGENADGGTEDAGSGDGGEDSGTGAGSGAGESPDSGENADGGTEDAGSGDGGEDSGTGAGSGAGESPDSGENADGGTEDAGSGDGGEDSGTGAGSGAGESPDSGENADGGTEDAGNLEASERTQQTTDSVLAATGTDRPWKLLSVAAALSLVGGAMARKVSVRGGR
ncbi:collagen-binding domain-containing protein [Demequina flava]|uniref:collagen-binding domain-containing protein n=1 Tax=Demequina flava TaxID=1095025 RepID=UPI001F23570B|nr:collagen-binding domain-containing protein [Demequina flava]